MLRRDIAGGREYAGNGGVSMLLILEAMEFRVKVVRCLHFCQDCCNALIGS